MVATVTTKEAGEIRELSKEECVLRLSEMHRFHSTDPEVLAKAALGDFRGEHYLQAPDLLQRLKELCRKSKS